MNGGDMAEPIDYVVTLFAVIIPTVGGALASRFILQSWQEKKEKFNLKMEKFKVRREILKDLENSYMLYYLLMSTLVIKANIYLTKKGFSFSDKPKSTSLPETELPKMKFKQEYQAVEKKLNGFIIENCWKFYNTWEVYFEDKKLAKTMNELAKISTSVHAAVALMFKADNFIELNIIKKKYDSNSKKNEKSFNGSKKFDRYN